MSDIYFILFYGVIFIIVLYLILSMLRPSTIIVEQPPTVPLWPWPITSYNWWPYWFSASNSGSGGSGGYSGTTRVYPSVGRPWGGASRMANGSGGGHSGGHGGGHGGGGHSGGGHGGGGRGGH